MRLQRHLGLGQGDMVVKDLPGTVPKAEAATVCAGRGAESADRKQERKFQGRYGAGQRAEGQPGLRLQPCSSPTSHTRTHSSQGPRAT